jgi:hypothetical protein
MIRGRVIGDLAVMLADQAYADETREVMIENYMRITIP